MKYDCSNSANVCNGIVGDSYTCCTSSNPCGLHQGDCDSDSECKDGLACGRDNCQSPFPSDADCCEQGNLTTIDVTEEVKGILTPTPNPSPPPIYQPQKILISSSKVVKNAI